MLPLDRIVERREGYLVVRSPSNPQHYWGNLLLFDDPPSAGDASRWERRFEAEFADEPRVRHRTFAWDRVDGALGCAREEFAVRGAVVELQVAGRDERFDENEYRAFRRRGLENLRKLCRVGRGGWYLALYLGSGEVVASCGVVVTSARARFQAVDTAAAYRRRGICSRLLLEAAQQSIVSYGAQQFVIVATTRSASTSRSASNPRST